MRCWNGDLRMDFLSSSWLTWGHPPEASINSCHDGGLPYPLKKEGREKKKGGRSARQHGQVITVLRKVTKCHRVIEWGSAGWSRSEKSFTSICRGKKWIPAIWFRAAEVLFRKKHTFFSHSCGMVNVWGERQEVVYLLCLSGAAGFFLFLFYLLGWTNPCCTAR